MKITISELELRISEPILDELTPWEMKTLKGGYVMRKDRINPPITTNTTDISTLLKELDSSMEQWKISLKDTTDSLINRFDF
ncbi:MULTISPECIES: hypothetical protein [Aphanizomenon]|uniref:hypothetical protein n=1 Tax=Aphanizomenon TaxID=1175 RepID=UPI000541A7F2|nr:MULTISPECIES: hypothetical protein [Aphanizomenon]KHG40132.1 hypothetical protein OA07_19375 [Aphanizomenon flos-aquae 2012/KM1/D3]MTJ29591.1 hypothetical protein [Aphanizomenon sp. UHCC 0183]QSV70999.1 MAG: hypothetical protein HEQ20_09885 [Aphanizomenon flos-aquae KM1D3_PB]